MNEKGGVLERPRFYGPAHARWYRCGGCHADGSSTLAGCGRWFGIDYRDPTTGETLQAHECAPVRQLSLFGAS